MYLEDGYGEKLVESLEKNLKIRLTEMVELEKKTL
jgi:hypothetical protein